MSAAAQLERPPGFLVIRTWQQEPHGELWARLLTAPSPWCSPTTWSVCVGREPTVASVCEWLQTVAPDDDTHR